MAVVVPIAADFDPSGVKQATTEFQLFGQAMERTFQQAASNARKAFDNVESSAAGASKKLKDTADDADRSRSVFANFAGNAAQEIPGLSQAFGPLNVAIGQFAEYAAEGGIKLKGLIAVAGPLAGIGIAVGAIAGKFADLSKNSEFAEERVDRLTESFRQGLTTYQALQKEFERGVKIRTLDEDAFQGLSGLSAKVDSLGLSFTDLGKGLSLFKRSTETDITPVFNKLGLTIEDINRIIAGGRPEIERYTDFLKQNGVAGKDVDQVFRGLDSTYFAIKEGQQAAAVTAQFLGKELAAAIPPADGLSVALGMVDGKAWAASKSLEIAQQQVQNLRDEVLASVNAEFAYADAIDNQAEAVARAQKARALANKTRKIEDIRAAERAERDVSKAVITTATAYGDLAAANNTATTGLDDATVAALGFYQQLEKGAAQFRPGGAVRGPLDEIIGRLEQGFPPEIRTRIVFDFATGQVSRTGTLGDPTGGRGGLVGVTTPVVTSNASAGTNVTVNVSGFVGSETQLTDTIRRGLNNDSNRRGADFVLP